MSRLVTVSRIGSGDIDMRSSSAHYLKQKCVGKQPLRTLHPLEDTLRQRGKSMGGSRSTPLLPRVDAPVCSQMELPTISTDNTDDFVAWYRQRQLQQLSTQHCGEWGPPLATATASGSGSRLRSSHGLDVTVTAQSRGWTQVRPSMAWTRQARELASRRASAARPSSPSRDKALHDRLQLLEHLECNNIPQGIGALIAALQWTAGSLDEAYACIGGDRVGLSLFRFAGGLALLGLDAVALCGFDAREALRQLDADGDGRVSLQDLQYTVARLDRAQMWSAPCSPSAMQAKQASAREEWWIAVSKFVELSMPVALSAWFRTPPALRRRGRGPDDMPPSPKPRKRKVASPSGEHAGEIAALARQQALDALRQCWAPSEEELEEVEHVLQAEYAAHATSHQFGEKLLNRSDLFRLVGNFPIPDLSEDATAQSSRAEVCDVYKEVIIFQASQPSLPGRGALTKGLTFESLRLVLLKMALASGFHFRHLVDDAIDALTGVGGPKV